MDPETVRVLLTPVELALATSTVPAAVGPSVTLGNTSAGETALYLRFQPSWREGLVHAGFLLLEPSPGSIAGPDLEIEVWRADGEWTGPGFSWRRQPGFSPPFARGIARSAPRMPVRIDVTELLRFFAEHPGRDFGFVLRAREERGPGVTLSTGLGSSPPPRLDVYLRQAKPNAQARALP